MPEKREDMRLHERTLILTDHAYARYCERVREAKKDEVEQEVRDLLEQGDCRKDGRMLLIGSNWWAIKEDKEHLLLGTCFGNTMYDMGRLARWEMLNRDKVNLFGAEQEISAYRIKAENIDVGMSEL